MLIYIVIRQLIFILSTYFLLVLQNSMIKLGTLYLLVWQLI